MKKSVNYLSLDGIDGIKGKYNFITNDVKWIYEKRDGQGYPISYIQDQLNELDEQVYTFSFSYDVYTYLYASCSPITASQMYHIISDTFTDYTVIESDNCIFIFDYNSFGEEDFGINEFSEEEKEDFYYSLEFDTFCESLSLEKKKEFSVEFWDFN